MQSKIDVIIPSFDAKHLLEKNLKFVFENTKYLGQVIVIDNGSKDGTSDWLKKNYPQIIIIRNETNSGYTIPINQGVKLSNSDFFVLLNNDVQPQKNYIESAINYFKDPKVFAVTFNEDQSSWPNMSWYDGKVQFSRGEDKTKAVYSAWASGGSAIFNRKLWDKLGSYDEIYAPWYWEDIDIGYRAWKSGFKIIWDPKAKVQHDHESTSKTLDQGYVNLIKQRNELLFNWINIQDKTLRSQHFKFLLTHTLTHPGYLKVIVSAALRLLIHPPLKRSFSLLDSEVLNKFSSPV